MGPHRAQRSQAASGLERGRQRLCEDTLSRETAVVVRCAAAAIRGPQRPCSATFGYKNPKERLSSPSWDVRGTIGHLLSLKATWPKWSESPSPVGEWLPWDKVKIAQHVIGSHDRTMTMPLASSPQCRRHPGNVGIAWHGNSHHVIKGIVEIGQGLWITR